MRVIGVSRASVHMFSKEARAEIVLLEGLGVEGASRYATRFAVGVSTVPK